MSKELQLDVLTALNAIVSKIDEVKQTCPDITGIRGWGSYNNKPSAYFVFTTGYVSCDITVKAESVGKDTYLSWRLAITSGRHLYAEMTATPVVNEGCTPSEFERTVLRVHHNVFDNVSDNLLKQYDAESYIYKNKMSGINSLKDTLRTLERMLVASLSE